MLLLCILCGKTLCPSCCGGRESSPGSLVVCTACTALQWAEALPPASDPLSIQQSQRLHFLAGAYGNILAHAQAPSTLAAYNRGLQSYLQFARGFNIHPPLPATAPLVTAFITDLVMVRLLDSSTIELYIQGLANWHRHLNRLLPGCTSDPTKSPAVRHLMAVVNKHYKKPSSAKRALSASELVFMLAACDQSRLGRHHHLCLTICTFGMMRQKAASHITVSYELSFPSPNRPLLSFLPDSHLQFGHAGSELFLDILIPEDKNHPSSRGPHHAIVPMSIPGLHVSPGRDIVQYIIDQQPPSGSYLLSAPLGNNKWRSTAYSKLGDVFKSAWQRAFPQLPVPQDVSSHSGRKTLAQLFHNAGMSEQLIAAAGGWSLLKRQAVHMYFEMTPSDVLSAFSRLQI